MLAKTYGAAVYGVNASIITIEVAVAQGLHFHLVGLPDSAVKESEQRVEASLKFFGYRMPRQKVYVMLTKLDGLLAAFASPGWKHDEISIM